ncbi:MAG: metal-dependent transcriptional regulator [Treponema sp.]|nr:metal-dependent transcriptional regulator [Treponema sp.]
MTIRESAEMYLESVLVLGQKGPVHAVEIARHLKISKPSVSVAIHNLESEKYILIDSDGHISLLPKGKEIAERIYERHTVLSEFFEKIGVSKENASADACKIEHDISDEAFEKVRELTKKL